MAKSVVGYTNDLAPEKIVYTGKETDTAIVKIDNDPDSPTSYQIGVFVKDSALGDSVSAADNSVIINCEEDRVKTIKVNISNESDNRLFLTSDGLYVKHDDYDDREVKANIAQNTEDIDNLKNGKQDKLQAGDNIIIRDNIIHAQVPTNVSAFENDMQYVTETALALKKLATEAFVEGKIAQIETIKFKKVSSVDDVKEKNIIYLVPNSKGTYDEYILIDGRPEKIGSTDVDLDAYAKKVFVTALIDEEASVREQSDVKLDDAIRQEIRDRASADDVLANQLRQAVTQVGQQLELKQDKLIAGDGIAIDGSNNIMAKVKTINNNKITGEGDLHIDADATMRESFITTVEVGSIPAGTIINSDTLIAQLLKQMLTGQGPVPPITGVEIYRGITDVKPTTLAELKALTKDASKTREELLASPYAVKRLNPNNQFVVLGIPKSCGLYVDKIKVSDFGIGFNEVDLGDYYMYVEENPVTLSNVTYEYYFEEV